MKKPKKRKCKHSLETVPRAWACFRYLRHPIKKALPKPNQVNETTNVFRSVEAGQSCFLSYEQFYSIF